ncbi:MAG: hypothetical protein QXI12_10755 [Candidatus Methanomethyliaceae archaeon]
MYTFCPILPSDGLFVAARGVYTRFLPASVPWDPALRARRRAWTKAGDRDQGRGRRPRPGAPSLIGQDRTVPPRIGLLPLPGKEQARPERDRRGQGGQDKTGRAGQDREEGTARSGTGQKREGVRRIVPPGKGVSELEIREIISARVPVKTASAARQLAAKRGVTMSAIVSRALAAYLRDSDAEMAELMALQRATLDGVAKVLAQLSGIDPAKSGEIAQRLLDFSKRSGKNAKLSANEE